MSAFSNLLCVVRRAILLLTVVLVTGCSSQEQKAQDYYERGRELLSKQEYVKASIEFRNAIQRKKDLIGAWRGLLEIELHNKNIQAAIPILQTIVELDPKDVDAKLKLGHYLFATNALDRAFELANGAVALDPRNPNALAFRAAVLLRLKENAQAVREAQAAIDLEPGNGEAAIVLAAERMSRGDNEGALSIIDRPGVTYKTEDEFPIQIFKLKIYEQSGDLKQLETTLRKLIDLYPFEAAIQRSLISFYVRQKRYDDAEKELRALSAASPSDVALGLNIVRYLQQFKGPDAARRELLSRINTTEQKFKYQLALADFDLAQGKVADSEKLLETLVNNAKSSEDIVAAQVKLAGIQFQQKKFDGAEGLVTSILRRDGRNLDGLKLRAALRLQQGQLDQAIADLRRALDDQPRATDLMVLLASAYERSGSMELADKQYADAIRASGFDIGVTLNYATFLIRRGNVERAEDILTQLAQQQPNNIAVLTSLADVKLARQNWAGAEEIAKTIRQIGNNERVGDQILAAALSGQGKYTDSIKLLENVRAGAPDAAQPLGALVNTMIRAKKLDEAVNFLQSELKKNPEKAEAYVLLGAVQIQKNLPDQAERSFRAAIERQPKDPTAYIALANFYTQSRKIDEAEKIIRAGLREQPDNFAMRLSYAGVMENKGDYEAAIAEYENLLKQDPGSLVAANNLASLLSDRRSDKASLERAYSAATILRKSQVPSFKDTLGWLDYLRGDYKSAISLLEEAATALPDRAMVQYHLGVAYSAAGQAAKAAEQFRKALALSPDSSLQEKITAAQKKTANN